MTDIAAMIEPIARTLLGDPNTKLSSRTELRFGAHGSISVDLRKGTFFDHEAQKGGGVLDLIEYRTGLTGKERFDWARDNGIELGDEAPRRTNGQHGLGNIVSAYNYEDEQGTALFQVVRFEPKNFRQRKPDKNKPDGWSWSVKGVRQVPYRLPELVEEIANGHPIFIVEGEKDADNLRTILNVPATTNAGGVGKWRDELNEHFNGADVIIIQDNDPPAQNKITGEILTHEDGRPKRPGQDHAHDVARHLQGLALRVRVLDLAKFWPEMPAKGDISDWLRSGGGNAQLLYEIVDRLPDWSPDQPAQAPKYLPLSNIRAWHGVDPKPRQWLVRNRIPARNVTLLTGQGGVGKTLLMQQLAVATVLGRDWIGEMPDPGPVLFITAEDDEDEMHFRFAQIAKFYNSSFNELADCGLNLVSLAGRNAVMAMADQKGIVNTTALFEELTRIISEIRPRWVGLDTAADIFVVNERDRTQVRQCISHLRRLSLVFNIAVILLAHPSLSGISSGSGLSGSTAWHNSVRSRMYLKTEKEKDKEPEQEGGEIDQGATRILEFMKSNYSALALPVRLAWRNGLFAPEPTLGSLPPIERAAIEERARATFLALLDRYNRQDRPVTYKERANNNAVNEFAAQAEAFELHKKISQRKNLLHAAMEYLLAKDLIHIGTGPKSAKASYQKPCLYRSGSLL